MDYVAHFVQDPRLDKLAQRLSAYLKPKNKIISSQAPLVQEAFATDNADFHRVCEELVHNRLHDLRHIFVTQVLYPEVSTGHAPVASDSLAPNGMSISYYQITDKEGLSTLSYAQLTRCQDGATPACSITFQWDPENIATTRVSAFHGTYAALEKMVKDAATLRRQELAGVSRPATPPSKLNNKSLIPEGLVAV